MIVSAIWPPSYSEMWFKHVTICSGFNTSLSNQIDLSVKFVNDSKLIIKYVITKIISINYKSYHSCLNIQIKISRSFPHLNKTTCDDTICQNVNYSY